MRKRRSAEIGARSGSPLSRSVTIPVMKKPLRLAMAQINVVVGDISGNARKISEWIGRAVELQADVVTFPELALTGYPPEDLLLKPQFIEANLADDKGTCGEGTRPHGDCRFRRPAGRHLQCGRDHRGWQDRAVYHKMYLPNYGVFDEFRYFRAGRECPVFESETPR
jgi:NAD+ synthase (glutamine-hydrolysing)